MSDHLPEDGARHRFRRLHSPNCLAFASKASRHPPKTPAKSFVKTILPVTPTRSRFCAQNLAIPMKTRNLGEGYGGEGGTHGYPPGSLSQNGNARRLLAGSAVRRRQTFSQQPASIPILGKRAGR